MNRLMLLAACCIASFCFSEEPVNAPSLSVEQPQIVKREIGLKINTLSKEQLEVGLTSDMIRDAIANELELGSLYIEPNMTLPSLVLHLRTIQAGLDMATYFQLSFQEEAMLVRTRSMYHATTWSQTSILACAPQNLKKEILETIALLARSFLRDYNKAQVAS